MNNPQPYLRLRIKFILSSVILVSLTDETVELCSSLLTLGRVETRFTLLSLNRSLVRFDLRSSLLTLGIAQTCLAILLLNRKLRLQ